MDSPVHGAFGLTYASFLVWPRVLMQEMPLEWQQRFVALAKEFNNTFEGYEPANGYIVMGRDQQHRFASPILPNYRHPQAGQIERYRRHQQRKEAP